jgi:hypothetical protein
MQQQPHRTTSRYAQELARILAAFGGSGSGEEEEPESQQEEEAPPTIHVYPVEGGGVLFSPVPLEVDELEEPDPHERIVRNPRVIDSQPPRIPAHRTPPFALFVLLLCLLLLLDAADSQLVFLLAPTVTITLTPVVRTLTLTSTAALGRQLAPLTLSQAQSVPTTGHGHQDAQVATGRLTLYNAAFTPQTVEAGTRFSSATGIAIVTEGGVTIPADAPPLIGQATIPAHAALAGPQGNLPALAINEAVSGSLYVKNLTPFAGGQDARDFPVVAQADLEQVAAHLKANVTASMTTALHSQLAPEESWLVPPSCTPRVRADHAVGEEAARLTVTVSETCVALAYRAQAVQQRATQGLTQQASRTLGSSYQPFGSVNVRVLRATLRASTVWLTFTAQGDWIYQLHPQQLVPLLLGRPRDEALRLLLHQPGIRTATISGIEGNAPLPTDPQHVTFLELEAF